jgi:iron complex outermembrane receptor protein
MVFAGTPAKKVDSLKVINLQEVQVVSTRANAKTPMAYFNLSKQAIKSRNFGQDLPFLLSLTPSVITSSDAGTGIGYTAIRVRGTDPSRINITANGIPVNDAESNTVFWVNMSDFASNLSNVQIQRGVGTSTNGGGAFGASLNMQTENFDVKPYGAVDLSAGSYGTHKETFHFGTGILGGHWAFQGRLSNIGSDGYIDRAWSKLNSYFVQAGYFSDNTMIKFITYNGTESTYHAWDYASKADMEKYGRTYNPCGQYLDANGKVAYYKNQTDNYHQQNYQLIWNQMLNSNWNLNIALHYTHGYGYYEQYKFNSDAGSVKLAKYTLTTDWSLKSDLVCRKIMDNDFYGFVGSLNYDSHSRLTASFGGGWNKYDGDHYGQVIWVKSFSGNLDPNHEFYNNNGTKYDGNFYGKLNYTLYKGLNAYVDLQYRHINYKMDGTSKEYSGHNQIPFDVNETYDFFNPKFGLFYDINANNTVYASYAIAHKEPTRNAFEDHIHESEYVAPKAERLNDLELGYKYQSRKFSAGLNFYYMKYDNQFVLTGAQDANGEMVARNIKDSYRMGLEMMAAWNPFKGFNWNANATWSRNRAKNTMLKVLDADWNESSVNVGSTHLAFSPDFLLNNVLSYEYKGFTASLMSKYVGKQYMTNSNFGSYTDANNKEISAMIDSYFTTDLDLSYNFKLKGLKNVTLGVTVYNLFNEEYESNGSCAMYFKQNNGKVVAFGDNDFWAWSTYSAQAPTNFLAHLSIRF